MKTMMTRTVNQKVRYYLFEVAATLFDEWIIIRTWGSCSNVRPTGTITQTYSTLHEAKTAMQSIVHQKILRGYTPINTPNKP